MDPMGRIREYIYKYKISRPPHWGSVCFSGLRVQSREHARCRMMALSLVLSSIMLGSNYR